jgi:hypothetical protein
LKFKTPRLPVYNNIKSLHADILKKQISLLRHEEKCVEHKLALKKQFFHDKLSFLDYHVLFCKFRSCIRDRATTILDTHNKKLVNLWKRQRQPSPDCLKNNSSKKLTIKEEDALRYGLNHHIHPPKLNEYDLKASVESHIFTAKRAAVIPELPTAACDEIKRSTLSFLNASKDSCRSKENVSLHRTLRDLRNDSNIKVCSFDKGNGVVILDSDDYYEKLDTIVLDTTKFKEIPIDNEGLHPIIKKENTII